jgi:predicted amidohydrolase YtcJ
MTRRYLRRFSGGRWSMQGSSGGSPGPDVGGRRIVSGLLLRQAVVDGAPVDVRIDGATVTRLGPPGTLGRADREIDCGGGALLPGLHDHHLHLMAMAAASGSIDVASGLDDALRTAHAQAPPGAWIRAVGYDESESGALDRGRLDALAPGRPVRVQHRSGAMWVLSSAALEQVGTPGSEPDGMERDPDGRPTGRLFRLDGWLHDRLPVHAPPDLAAVGRRLASFGVTGVTDCTPNPSVEAWRVLAGAVRDGTLPCTVAVTGGPALSGVDPPGGLRRGPVKVVLSDHALPELQELVGWFGRAHRVPRPVAVHCVTRAALVLALAAWQEAGSVPGDRIEHASVTPVECIAALTDLGIAVVTQPAFIAARGDAYLRQVDREDRPDLYRCRSLLDAGVAVGGSTDAPFGPDDPWLAMGAAMDRRSAAGVRVGQDEGLTATAALGLFLAPLDQPGGAARQVQAGQPADLCLLGVPIGQALVDPSGQHVAMTMAGGLMTYAR